MILEGITETCLINNKNHVLNQQKINYLTNVKIYNSIDMVYAFPSLRVQGTSMADTGECVGIIRKYSAHYSQRK